MRTINLLSFLLVISLISCQKEENILPKTEELYIFPHKSEVDALNLGCGYNIYEDCGDWIKKIVRKRVKNPSTEELIELGKYFHKNSIPYHLTSHKRGSWAKEIVDNMKPFLVENEFPYNVYVVKTSIFNAFTIPGGNIYVTTGLLDAVNNKDQLAYIMGHELGHNENDHTRESARLYKYIKQSEGKSYFRLAKSILAKFGSDICGKSDELESDIASIYLLYKAGYDPELALGGIDLLRRYSTPKPDNYWEEKFMSFLSTHPWSEDRDACATSYVRNAKVKVECEKIFKNQEGVVATKVSPLNAREYPIKRAKSLVQIPKGEYVKVICDCVEQKYRKSRDWLFVEYAHNEELIRGWVDKKYIDFIE